MQTAEQSNAAREATEKEARDLLDAGNYEALDQKAAELEKGKVKTLSGNWLIFQVVGGLERPFTGVLTADKPRVPATKEQWKAHLEKLEKWKDKTGSAFSLAILGTAETSYAWSIRGSGFADSVSAEQWKGFGEVLTKAVADLEAAKAKDPKELETYRNLLTAGLGMGWSKEKLRKLFNEFLLIEPEYGRTFECMATPLLQRWVGAPGEWQSFVNSIPKLVPGDSGLEIYARLVWAMDGYASSPQDLFGEGDHQFSWETARAGFEVIRKRYPDSALDLNLMLKYYCVMGDREGAKSILKTLDDNKAVSSIYFGGATGEAAARKFVAGE